MKTLAQLGAIVACLSLLPVAGEAGKQETGSPDTWIHVEVREDGGKDATVKVNLPFALAEAALSAVEDSIDDHVRIGAHGDGELTTAELREMWHAMRDAGDAEFVTVQEEGEKVRIYTRDGNVHVDVDDREGGETVRVRMPIGMLDALLAGEGEELDVRGALAYLRGAGRHGELVRVEEGEDLVRIWVDDRPEHTAD